jgi:hypothetical protein
MLAHIYWTATSQGMQYQEGQCKLYYANKFEATTDRERITQRILQGYYADPFQLGYLNKTKIKFDEIPKGSI